MKKMVVKGRHRKRTGCGVASVHWVAPELITIAFTSAALFPRGFY